MCGIAGVFESTSKSEKNKDLKKNITQMLSNILHRGMENLEIDAGTNWAIGANRLPIVDRENGKQPKSCNESRFVAVLNGEIYNYLELKETLEKQGFLFNTNTDTEVVANGYKHWGNELFDKLDGVFAILIYDKEKNQYIACRDPIGVKPLYFIESKNNVLFASEIKAFTNKETNIKQISPGAYVIGNTNEVKYSQQTSVYVSNEIKKNAKKLRDLIRSAVAKRVKTDLPIAVFLSGGVDSSIVLYEANQHHTDVVAYTIGLRDSTDVQASIMLCQELNVELKHIDVTSEQMIKLIPEAIETLESFEPNLLRNGILSILLSKVIAADGYRIALCGEGADELFGGYGEFNDAIQSGSTEAELQHMFRVFQIQLHETQLQRVDRASMRYALEVRVPYLDKKIVYFSNSLSVEDKISMDSQKIITNKKVLRYAYENILPNNIIHRQKTVFCEGAGFGGNGSEGIFYEYGKNQVSNQKLEDLQNKYPDYKLKTNEEAYYFSLFVECFGALQLAKDRPLVNVTLDGIK